MSLNRNPQPLGSVLESLVQELGIKQKLDEVRAIEAWADLAGASINGVTDAAWVRGNKLYVKIISSTWRQELHMQRRDWRDRLNLRLGSPVISEIVFR